MSENELSIVIVTLSFIAVGLIMAHTLIKNSIIKRENTELLKKNEFRYKNEKIRVDIEHSKKMKGKIALITYSIGFTWAMLFIMPPIIEIYEALNLYYIIIILIIIFAVIIRAPFFKERRFTITYKRIEFNTPRSHLVQIFWSEIEKIEVIYSQFTIGRAILKKYTAYTIKFKGQNYDKQIRIDTYMCFPKGKLEDILYYLRDFAADMKKEFVKIQ